MNRSPLIAAVLAGILALPEAQRRQGKVLVVDDGSTTPPPDSPPRERREPLQYPYYNVTPRQSMFCGTKESLNGKRQGARIAKGKYDFGASERCIARIKAKNRTP